MTIRSRSDGRTVVALIATHGRMDLLLERAIPSVLKQSLKPDYLVVVVDEPDKRARDACEQRIRVAAESFGESLVVLGNYKTPDRAAGAWNTGVDWLVRQPACVTKPDLVFVAILDDDDAWEPEHLQACYDAAIERDLNMVVAGLIRHEGGGEKAIQHAIPAQLNPQELFIHGQHIQGSNLFVRLDMLLKAGLFDERLPSCTDRDLCMRLADLPELRFGSVERYTVHHVADLGRLRLSTPGSLAKVQGLQGFWNKYHRRFDGAAQCDALTRAQQLFRWTPSSPVPHVVEIPALVPPVGSFHFVIGFVTDSDCPKHVEGLLSDLCDLAHRAGVSGVDVLIVENGPHCSDGPRRLQTVINQYRMRGLRCFIVDIEQQQIDPDAGRLGPIPRPGSDRLRIAVTRTMLAYYVGHFAKSRPGCVAWILDDDKRLSVQIDRGDGTIVNRPSPDLAALERLREQGVDVVLGPDTESPPLPFISTLRMQLVDTVHNVAMGLALDPDQLWPDRGAENSAILSEFRDSYYDLARTTEHLETPVWMKPEYSGERTGLVMKRIAARLPRILAGEQVFRPLVISAKTLSDTRLQESIQRGGSAIFFRPEVLLDIPHTIARLGERFTRRSDMLVTLLMRQQMEQKAVLHAAAAVRHDRHDVKTRRMDETTLWDDVLGYAIVRAFEETSRAGSPDRRKRFVKLARKYVNERLVAYVLSAFRAIGLAASLKEVIRRGRETRPIWANDPEAARALCEMEHFADRLLGEHKQSAILKFTKKVKNSASERDLEQFFDAIAHGIESFHRMNQVVGRLTFADDQRVLNAKAAIERLCEARDLSLLGCGDEGVVMHDGTRIYKVFDGLSTAQERESFELLGALCGKLDDSRRLCCLERIIEDGGTTILIYQFEASEPYHGGHGTELIELLRECRAAGIVCRNIHPKNLRITASGLRLIDFGRDTRAFNETEFKMMAERAWLTWRWHHRADLSELMHRAINDKHLPELDGFQRFWQTVVDDSVSARMIVANMLEPLICASGAQRILDYGCGKGMLVRLLAGDGRQVIGFDPDETLASRWDRDGKLSTGAQLTSNRDAALAKGPFDAIVCSLVLCELEDGVEYERVLADIAGATTANGTAYIAVCNPFFTFGGPTRLHRKRMLPSGARYEECFTYQEIVSAAGVPRTEHHRPLSRLRRDLLRHGLRIVRTLENAAVDTERFEPSSDFLVMVCEKVLTNTPRPDVSLLIKTCAQECETIERQVEHIVGQLEGPQTFVERVVVIDCRASGFLRQYATPDSDKLLAAVERLQQRGLVDRVVQVCDTDTTARSLNVRWFGIDATSTHAENGGPVTAPLMAIESCVGDFVLQVDSDVLIARRDLGHDYLADMIGALGEHPDAITVAFNIAHDESRPYTTGMNGSPWRVECRACLLHRRRLLDQRPYPNSVSADGLQHPWHRSLDVACREGRAASLRGGDHRTYFIHPSNQLKSRPREWMLVVDSVEKGRVPHEQTNEVDLAGAISDWLPHERREPFVFIITGRNVAPGRMRRCLDSLLGQQRSDWGAVFVDDGSDALTAEYLRMFIGDDPRFTLLQPRCRRGLMANLVDAIRVVCVNPSSVIITLDMDDALLGHGVLDRVAREFENGADVTVGSMLRTDKHVEYQVSFENPRGSRGGNVWQHLRAFRKRLFDALPDHLLRIDGEYVDLASDWAYMLPIVESAERPVWIRDPLYLYEPSGVAKGAERGVRESRIGRIVAKPAGTWLHPNVTRIPIEAERILSGQLPVASGVLLVRHAERPRFTGIAEALREDVSITTEGRQNARSFGGMLDGIGMILSSPIRRCMETAEAIAEGNLCDSSRVCSWPSLCRFRGFSDAAYALANTGLGWDGLMRAWVENTLPAGLLVDRREVTLDVLSELMMFRIGTATPLIVAVTHDFMITAVLSALRGGTFTSVPYLGSILLTWDEIRLHTGKEVEA